MVISAGTGMDIENWKNSGCERLHWVWRARRLNLNVEGKKAAI